MLVSVNLSFLVLEAMASARHLSCLCLMVPRRIDKERGCWLVAPCDLWFISTIFLFFLSFFFHSFNPLIILSLSSPRKSYCHSLTMLIEF
ncbi:hypothetical protein I7I48_10985 [Histoplasma ohiense]|nr:hypothetical protein I7I48_10985 [Histoplasma ohiense (nom. inval.)]